ncbi:hypothetical protein BC833DRAFT_582678 [Globomyces pollinis-pini]|nr:hypothetical protein BC833DRAFT_582678 [Globomyces pollinis-pini]
MFSSTSRSSTAPLPPLSTCVQPSAFVDEEILSFLLPTEIPYILLKSTTQQHVFTNLAYISRKVDESNTKTIQRYDYLNHKIADVTYETSDTIIKFTFRVDARPVLIRVSINEFEILRKYYKAIVAVSKAQVIQAKKLDIFTKIYSNQLNMTEQAGSTKESVQLVDSIFEQYCDSYGTIFYEHLFK